MNKLYHMLPVAAPDYCGAMSVFVKMNCLMVFHGQGGCVGNYSAVDEIKWMETGKRLVMSRISETEAVTGCDESFVEKVVDAFKRVNCEFVVVFSSPIAMITGIDIPALCRIIEKKIEHPVIAMNTHGFTSYAAGIELAYEQIYNHFIKQNSEQKKCMGKTASLIGATSYDGFPDQSVQDMKDRLYAEGYDQVFCWGEDFPLGKWADVKNTEKNYVVSVAGLKVAEAMKKEMGIPYEVGIPVGMKDDEPENQKETDLRILIIGEQIQGNSIRACLEREFGIEAVDVVSMFKMEASLMREKDKAFKNENELTEYLKAGEWDYVIADPLYKVLVSEKVGFIPLPHLAVSSRINTKELVNLIGENGSRYLKRFIEN